MIHPHTELRFISPEIGYGVFATQFIPKGTITWAYDSLDQIITPKQMEDMDSLRKTALYKYTYRDEKGNHVLCWDISRYVNHSFHTKCISTAYNIEIAAEDIFPGEEITNDYGYLNWKYPFKCFTEAGSARTQVMPDDLLSCYKEWDSMVIEAFQFYQKVKQPLNFLIPLHYRNKIINIIKGIDRLDSIVNCFYSDEPGLMKLKENLLLAEGSVFENANADFM